MNLSDIIKIGNSGTFPIKLTDGYRTPDGLPFIRGAEKLLLDFGTISRIPGLGSEVEAMSSILNKIDLNGTLLIEENEWKVLKSIIESINGKFLSLLTFARQAIPDDENVIHVRLPSVLNFEDLAKVSNDLKHALQTPILASNTGGKVEILSVEKGSIWLTISLYTASAVTLVGLLVRGAFVVVKHYVEMQAMLEGMKRLKIGTEVLQTVADAHKVAINNILEAEAKAIQNDYFDPNDPEITERLKLSLETIQKMSSEGLQIKAGKVSEDGKEAVKLAFPASTDPMLIESITKQITQGDK
ncbi:hypothetical protein [Taibaiella koreensis]|uniref:hypothetical protein n=1 Tax=Taibaiella koreensis TaxID=1268548 RepID=UPI000E599967|nr:hypothetical protein [Taibaiella koreensis]